MKPSLQVRLSQHLALTPQLQQSIRLLQLSTLELHQEVGQMLDQNPFLETEDEAPTGPFDLPPERVAADRAGESDDGYRADSPDAGEAAPEIRAEEFGTPSTRRLGERHRGRRFRRHPRDALGHRLAQRRR